MNALASVSSNYRAMVCIFLAGERWPQHGDSDLRPSLQKLQPLPQGRQTLALAQASLQAIQNGADTYGLHPLMPEMAALYNAGNAAVVANVGTLVKPITPLLISARTIFRHVPAQLFSHADQVNQWQAAVPNGRRFTGWGGLAEDSARRPERGRGVLSHHIDIGLRAVLHRASIPYAVYRAGGRGLEPNRGDGPAPGRADIAGVRQRPQAGAGRECHHEPRRGILAGC